MSRGQRFNQGSNQSEIESRRIGHKHLVDGAPQVADGVAAVRSEVRQYSAGATRRVERGGVNGGALGV